MCETPLGTEEKGPRTMIYGRFGDTVTIVRVATLEDVKVHHGEPDKIDRDALEDGSYVIVKQDDGKERLYHLTYLRATRGYAEIADTISEIDPSWVNGERQQQLRMTRRIFVSNIPVRTITDGWVEVPDDTPFDDLDEAIATALRTSGFKPETCTIEVDGGLDVDQACLDAHWEFSTPLEVEP